MIKRISFLFGAAGLLAALLLFVGCGSNLDTPIKDVPRRSAPRKITFFHTTDTHSKFLPFIGDPNSNGTDRRQNLLRPESNPYGGVARLATLLKWQRQMSGLSFYVDTGDIFQGAPIFNLFKGRVEVLGLHYLGADVMAIGNHEFDNGTNMLVKQLSLAKGYPFFLLANYAFENPTIEGNKKLADMVRPYVIIEKDGFKVAFIGMGDYSSITSLNIFGNSLGIMGIDPVDVLNEIVPRVRPYVDLVVVVSHMGLDDDRDTFRNVSGVGLVFGGHNHTITTPPIQVLNPEGKRVLILHSGVDMKYMNRLDVVVQDGEVIDYQMKTFPIDSHCHEWSDGTVLDCPYNTPQTQFHSKVPFLPPNGCVDYCLPEDPELANLVAPFKQSLDLAQDMSRIIGTSRSGFLRKEDAAASCSSDEDCCFNQVCSGGTCVDRMPDYSEPYGADCYSEEDCKIDETCNYEVNKCQRVSRGDSALGNLITEAMQLYPRLSADFAITNSLGIRTDFPPGDITMGKLYEVFPFENSLTLVYLSGIEIQELFDFVARKSGARGCQNQVQISGAEVVLDCSKRKAKEVKIGDTVVIHNYELVAPFASFVVATNDYMAQGGSGFNVFRWNTTQFDTMISLRDVLVDYMATHSMDRCKIDYRAKMLK